jgi:hypothetical protein
VVRKVLIAVAAVLAAAPTALAAKPSPGLSVVMANHPGGTLTAVSPGAFTPQYVFGQAFCYSAVEQYSKGVSGGIAQEGLWVRPNWCAVPGVAPHIYSIDQGYRYQICSGLIQCAGTAGPFLASGGNGSAWADYEWIGYYHWSAQGITASAQMHLVWELQEDGTQWSYGWS